MIFPPVYQPAPLMLAEPAAYSSSSPAHHLVDKTVGTTPTHTTVLPLAPYPLIGGGGGAGGENIQFGNRQKL